ncbi:hypothetical protein BH10ACI4_BH10ACI4_26300 [soil metagenome]
MQPRLLSVLAGLAMLSAPMASHADTITVTFTQSSYLPAGYSNYTGSLTGTFTGTLESDGTLKSGDLSNFQATFTLDNPSPDGSNTFIISYDLASLGLSAGSAFTEPFFYDPSKGASSLSFEAASPSRLCVGLYAAFDEACQLYNANQVRSRGVFLRANYSYTASQEVVITSIVHLDVPVLGPEDPPVVGGGSTCGPTPVAVTPEPASLLLFATGLGGVASILRRRGARRG